jgi:hypothetical protein
VIHIKPLSTYYDDDDRAILTKQSELKLLAKRWQGELANIDAKIANRADVEIQSEDSVQNLIDGIETERPIPLGAQRNTIQHKIRDTDMAEDWIADKVRVLNIKAGRKLAADIKPQADAAETALADAMIVVHEKQLVCWNAKRHLIGNGIGCFGLFDSNDDDILGIPVDRGTPLADYFRNAVKRRLLRSVPKEYAV